MARGVLALSGRHPGPRGRPRAGRRARQDPPRDCAAARWRRSARSPSAATTAASTPRRCSSCSPAPTSSAPATSPSSSRIWPNVERALAWIDDYGDPDGDGFVEYARRSPNGLIHQGWKDSDDSVFHADGELAEGPIALCEVQGYVYAARRAAARLARLLGHDAPGRRAASARPRRCGSASSGRSGARSSAPTPWPWTAPSGPAACGPPTPASASSPASPAPSGPGGWPSTLLSRDVLLRLGRAHPGSRPRPATTRCRTTTARSGRTTTP